MPTNILIRRVRRRDGLRWGIALAVLGLFYAAAGTICALLVQHGANGWWNLGFLLCFWNVAKLVSSGLSARFLLAAARHREARAARASTHAMVR
ncbi:sulfate permease [Microbacterium rhizophilus]|uniref:sulfate permease n=1 Tax=Microbacterium rhizophilus TaxID=3138934 RepID=UPI0031ECD8D9